MSEFVPFDQRPEWADVQPVPQDDGPAPVVRIAYTRQFENTMDYMRAMWKADERSQRALDLTGEVIALNPGNYTCWHFRRLCLDALGSDLAAELEFVSDIARESPKNYQLWYHRQAIVERMGHADNELAFTAEILADDAKNYHAFAHRQWCIATFGLWDNEDAYVASLLDDDVRNNSAWNEAFYVWTRAGAASPAELAAKLPTLIEMTMARIGRAPNNEAAWNFLYGILERALAAGVDNAADTAASTVAAVLDKAGTFIASTALRAFYVRAATTLLPPDADRLATAKSMAETLGANMDTIRTKYWAYRVAQIDALVASL